MASKYVSADGEWTVEVITLEKRGGPRQCIKVSRHGFLVADCATVEEVARHLDLSTLQPVE